MMGILGTFTAPWIPAELSSYGIQTLPGTTWSLGCPQKDTRCPWLPLASPASDLRVTWPGREADAQHQGFGTGQCFAHLALKAALSTWGQVGCSRTAIT